MARPTEPTDAPPAGLSGAPPLPAPRPGLGVAVAVLLGLGALGGLWAAFTGVGPARLDAVVLGESVESRTDLLTAAAVAVTNLGSTVAMAVLAVAVGVRLWFTGRRADAERAATDHVTSCSEPQRYAMGANRQIADATELLLNALNAAVEDAARLGDTDTGARRAAAALVDARIGVYQAITAAGRALADRERTVDVPAGGVSTATAA